MTSYNEKILRVNLTTRKITTEKLDLDTAKKFLGGRGLGTKLLLDEIDPMVDPLSEGNKMFFITGALTGTKVSTGGRYMVVTKSPLNNCIASSNSGGQWGAKLKYAGYDVLIVEGKSNKPVYLNIDDDKVEICDADVIWGRETEEVEAVLKEKYADSSVLNIGPAGESLSLMAAIMNDADRAAARTGVGAVMGSKKLKAIVVTASKIEMEVADPEKFAEVSKKLAKTIKSNPVSGVGLAAYGTSVLVNVLNSVGSFPINNWQASEFEHAENVCGEEFQRSYLKGRSFCHRCTIGCGRVVELNGKKIGGPEYETIWGFSGDTGLKNFETIIKANYLCNEYGLDTISTSSTIAAAMELQQRGYIKEEEFNGVPLVFGDDGAVLEWIKRIGRPTSPLAKLMAKGSYELCEFYGHPEYSMSVKKLEMPAYDPRGIQGIGLNYATSNRGGCHVRGYTIPAELLGMPIELDRISTEGKAFWVINRQDLAAIIDSLGMCLFTSFALGVEHYTEIFNAATGSNLTTEEMMETGERIYNIERLFNQKAGMKPEDDTLPQRLLKEPITNKLSEGMVNHLDEMLPEYYKVRGWENAFPTETTLKRLGLN